METNTQSGPSATCVTGWANPIYHEGLDTLHITYTGSTKENKSNQLNNLREKAKNKNEVDHCLFELAGQTLRVLPHGSGHFAYALKNDYFYIIVSRPGSKLPALQIQIKSEAFLKFDAEEVCKLADLMAEDLALITESHVSRVDQCMDFKAPSNWNKLTHMNFICRARNLVQYRRGAILQGVSIGMGGHVALRLYDKTHEIKETSKLHWLQVWSSHGWRGEGRIIRAEYELKRHELKEMGLITWQDVLASKAKIWQHYSTNWFRMVEVNQSDTHRERWQVSDWWRSIAMFYGEWPDGLTRLKPDLKPVSESYKYRNGFSALLSHMATTDHCDIRDALNDFMECAKHYHGGYDGLLEYLKKKLKHHRYMQAKRSMAKGFFIPSPQYMSASMESYVISDNLDAIPF